MNNTHAGLTPSDCEAAVVLGVEVLDEHRPGWHRKIDRERLSMVSLYDCIVGQLSDGAENYCHALTALAKDAGVEPTYLAPDGYGESQSMWAAEHGFTFRGFTAMGVPPWEELNGAWDALLASREDTGADLVTV